MPFALAVLIRILANPFSNLLQKKLTGYAAHSLFIITAVHALLSLAMLPPLVAHASAILQQSAWFWLNMTIVATLAVCGNALLVQALRLGDLSIMGPINAYKSIVSMGFSILLIGELPNAWGLVGSLCILLGSYVILGRSTAIGRTQPSARFGILANHGVQLRLAALLCSALEAVFLKRCITLSSPIITFILWCALGFLVSLPILRFGMTHPIQSQYDILIQQKWHYMALAFMVGLMQYTTLVAFDGMQISYALALFQTSALISVLLGHQFFKEGQVLQRLVGSSIMVIGAMLIVLQRS